MDPHFAELLRISSSVRTRAIIADATGTGALATAAAAAVPSGTASVRRAGAPDAAIGTFLSELLDETRLADAVTHVLATKPKLAPQLRDSLSAWLATRHNHADPSRNVAALKFADVWLAREGAFDSEVQAVYNAREMLPQAARWIVADEASPATFSAVHALLSSGENVKMLILADAAPGASSLRRDIGLFALTYGGATVASVCGRISAAQATAAFTQADAFSGPSVVLALTAPLAAASPAVASGEWPLYRWNPSTEALTVDSPKLRADIAAFLDRENALSLLARATPAGAPSAAGAGEQQLSATGASSAAAGGGSGNDAIEATLLASYKALVRGVDLPPLTILYGSDGGNAEGLAKKLAVDARERGFPSVTISPADHNGWASVDALARAQVLVFIVSTAGQGEFPSNSRACWKALSTAAAAVAATASAAASTGASAAHETEGSTSTSIAALTSAAAAPLPLASTRFAVFGLGDSLYWPRKEHAAFYNKPSSDADAALAALGAVRLVERGMGDDQEVGGFGAGFRAWVPALWESLGLGTGAPSAAAGDARVRGNESIKITSNLLRGTIAQGLEDTSTGALSYEDTQLTKVRERVMTVTCGICILSHDTLM